MNGKILAGLTLGLIGLASVGCTSAPGIVRAQAPPDGSVVYGTPQNPCPQCGSTDGTCAHCCLGLGYEPHHRVWSHYTQPDAATCCLDGCGCCHLAGAYCPFGTHGPLVYPPNPTPGAIVQYPYYTCKGPDDFFSPAINTSGAH